jgi:hypothetical protein
MKPAETAMNTLGKIFVARTRLAVALASAANAAARPGPAKAAALAKAPPEKARASALKPLTWGMARPSLRHATQQKLALAVLHPASGVKAVLRPDISAPANIVIDVLVAYTRNAARHYYEIERDVIDPPSRRRTAPSASAASATSGSGLRRRFDRLRRAGRPFRPCLVHGRQARPAHGAYPRVARSLPRRCCHPNRRRCQGLRTRTRIGADAEDAFAVVHHECAAANYTLAHEIGHLIGARHELGYVSGTSWRDIMGYKEDCGGCPRLPVWSNPLVTIAGEAAGTAEPTTRA